MKVAATTQAVAALFVFAVLAGGGPAYATADGNNTDSGVTVTVPSASPTATPSQTPSVSPNPTNPPNPPTTPPPSATAPTRATGTSTGTQPTTDTTTTTCTPTEPAVPTKPATNGDKATTDKNLYLPGQQVTATGSGYAAGEQVQLVLFSDPQLVGTFTADPDGQVQAVFPVADTTSSGSHIIQFTGWCKKIETATILVGAVADGTGAAATGSVLPPWIWWPIGAAALGAFAFALWRIIAAMRGPVESGRGGIAS